MLFRKRKRDDNSKMQSSLGQRKENFIYVGIDLHKETHTAVILNCWNEKLGEITFENKTSGFPKLVRKVSWYLSENLTPVYGLENAYGYGRALAVWLLEHEYIVKDVNTSQRSEKNLLKHDQSACLLRVAARQLYLLLEILKILYLRELS